MLFVGCCVLPLIVVYKCWYRCVWCYHSIRVILCLVLRWEKLAAVQVSVRLAECLLASMEAIDG